MSYSHKDILNANVTYEMIAIPIQWYAWQLAYNHDVINTNDVAENVLSVLSRIEVVLNKYFNQNIKINNLFIDIKN